MLDMFRVNAIKTERDTLRAERDALQATLADTQHMDYHALQTAIANLRAQQAQAEADLAAAHEQVKRVRDAIAAREAQATADAAALAQRRQRDLDARLTDLAKQVTTREAQIIQLDDTILLQEVGFYKPKYDLMNTEAYRMRLESLRAKQAAMVKAGTAAKGATSWTINNSAAEGTKMIKDYVKLILRSFNNECEASISTVKFSNLEAIEKRIRKAYDTLNVLGARMSIAILPEYLVLKLEELYLCHEFQIKKQAEKDELKLLREQQREEARVLREIEEMKLKIGKEEKHFAKALLAVQAQLATAGSDAERTLLEQERTSIERELAQIEANKQDILNREQNTRAGYVYVISNMGAFGENIFKIGVTRRLEPQERIDELGDASVPFDFDIHALIFSENAPALEHALHKAFETRRLNMINRRREFFAVSLEEIQDVVRRNFSKPVEFVPLADAAEYRQSLALRPPLPHGTPA